MSDIAPSLLVCSSFFMNFKLSITYKIIDNLRRNLRTGQDRNPISSSYLNENNFFKSFRGRIMVQDQEWNQRKQESSPRLLGYFPHLSLLRSISIFRIISFEHGGQGKEGMVCIQYAIQHMRIVRQVDLFQCLLSHSLLKMQIYLTFFQENIREKEDKRLSISEGVLIFDSISQLNVRKSMDLKIHLGQLNFLKLFLLKDQKYLCQNDRC